MSAGPGLCRRELLGGAVALAAAELAAPGCVARGDPSTRVKTSVTLSPSDIAPGGRLTVMLGSNPVELRRDGRGLSALMLRCTHTGCVVRWDAPRSAYLCPCHEGRFDADGRVLSGPPPLPLRSVPVREDASRIVVGG